MPYWLQFLLFSMISGLAQYIISYFKEKGKNLATKEDVEKITKKVEEIKTIYASSLEKYKFELQKKFESSKYIIELCNNIDRELIQILLECQNKISDEHENYSEGIFDAYIAQKSILKLKDYLNSYKSRYDENEFVQKVLKKCNELDRINENYENCEDKYFHSLNFFSDRLKIISDIEKNISLLLYHFLPPL